MNARIFATALTVVLITSASAFAQSAAFEVQLQSAAKRLCEQIDKAARKKLAILDVTELDGRSSELGRYIAEQMTIEVITTNHNFVMVDQANRDRILAQIRESNSGVFKPEDVKRLGQLSGADTILLGKFAEASGQAFVTFTLSATDTGELIGGARMSFSMGEREQIMIQRGQGAGASPMGRPKAATDKRFSAKKTTSLHGPVEAVLTNFVAAENEARATVKLRNTGKAAIKIGLDWNRYNAAQVRAGYGSVYVGGEGAGFRASLTDSSGVSMGFADVKGIEIGGFKTVNEAPTWGDADRVIPKEMGMLSDIPAGGDLDIVLLFKPPAKKVASASAPLELDMSFRLQVGLYYSEVRQQGYTKPVRSTPTFEDIRPRQ